MKTFFNTCETIREGTNRNRQIMANVSWAAGGVIVGIFHPVNTTTYRDRIHAIQLIHNKTLNNIKQLKKEEPSQKVQKKIKLMKLLNSYNIKAFSAHRFYISHLGKLKPEQKKEFRKEYKEMLVKIEDDYKRKRSQIRRGYQD